MRERAGDVRRHARGAAGARARVRRPRPHPAGAGQRVSRRVLIADDDALARAALRAIFDAHDDLELIAEARRRSARRSRMRAAASRRRAARHPDAEPRRTRGGAPDPRLELEPRSGDHAHHLRPRRVRLRRAEGGRQRVPAQGHPARAAARVRALRRRGGRAARSDDHPPADRALRAAADVRATGRLVRADPARTRGAHPSRPRSEQRRDRR